MNNKLIRVSIPVAGREDYKDQTNNQKNTDERIFNIDHSSKVKKKPATMVSAGNFHCDIGL